MLISTVKWLIDYNEQNATLRILIAKTTNNNVNKAKTKRIHTKCIRMNLKFKKKKKMKQKETKIIDQLLIAFMIQLLR